MLAYGPMTAPGASRSTNPSPDRKMSFSERGDSPPNPSSAQYGSISHDGRSRNTPSRSRMPAENDRPTSAYGDGDGPSSAPLIARPMRVKAPGVPAGPTSNGCTRSPRI